MTSVYPNGPTNNNNTIGALIFSAYVISALLITIYISLNHISTYKKWLQAEDRKQPADLGKRLQIFSTLSVLSFSSLSYHMLNYLIVSYRAWAQANNSLELHIWRWLTSSTLFQDFAETICGTSARFWWAQQALLVTMAWSVFMGFEGLSCTILNPFPALNEKNSIGRKRKIPHLWAYAFISQILPVSFAQNLFCIAILLHPVAQPNQKIWTPTPIIQLLPLIAYYLFVLGAPFVAGTRAFIAIVIVVRLLLFSPLILPAIVPEGGGQSYLTLRKASWADASPFQFIGICSALLWLLQTLVAFKDSRFVVNKVIGAINDSPAVSALGYDYILSLISLGTWAFVADREMP